MNLLTDAVLDLLKNRGWAFAKIERTTGAMILHLRRNNRRQTVWGIGPWDCAINCKRLSECKNSKETVFTDEYYEVGKGWG